MAQPFLQDYKLQADLDKNGYVSFPLLNQSEVDYLLNVYEDTHAARGLNNRDDFFISLHTKDAHFKEIIHKECSSVIIPHCNTIFNPYKQTTFSMLTKGVGPKSEFDIHQDWSITDETKYKAYNFWIALHDSDEHNGTLYFLPGSHEKFRVIRGSGIHGMFDQVGPSLLKLMKPVAVKKGHAVLFDAAVVHYSPPNLSKHPRISIVNYFTNKNADLLLYHFDGFDTLEIYSVDEKFLLQYKYFPDERNIPPSFGIKIGTVRPFHPKQLTVTDIAEFDNDILIK